MKRSTNAAPTREMAETLSTSMALHPSTEPTAETAHAAQMADGSSSAPMHTLAETPSILMTSLDPFTRDDLILCRELYRKRMDLLAARNRLDAQLRAIVRRSENLEECSLKDALAYEWNAPFLPVREILDAEHKAAERMLVKHAKTLPEYVLIADMKGFGDLTFAAVVAECGDLRCYATQGKIWKRMGLALVDGERQRRVAGDAEKAIKHGYSPRRRAIMFNFSDSAVKVGGYYAERFKARKRYEIERVIAAGGVVYGVTTDTTLAPLLTTAAKAKKHDGLTMALIHAHKRALRYIAKLALRDLWSKWRAQ